MYRLTALWQDLRASFWFLPSLIVALAIALAFVLTHFDDSALEQWMKQHPLLFGASAEGARAMLSTIAGSMITVVGIVFSMTLVALALASSQYSPRVLRSFMRSRVTQAAIGTFAGIFVYCVIVLRGVHGQDDTVFVPVLAVSLAVLLAVVGVAMLIFFIHHIALSIQASTILANIADETVEAVNTVFAPLDAQGADGAEGTGAAQAAAGDWTGVAAVSGGYLQSIDIAALHEIARCGQAAIRVERGIGQFVHAGTSVFSVARAPGAPPHDPNALLAAIVLSPYRSVTRDPAFGIGQLVDIALKALSPGVNDTATALMCLDYLGAVMGALSRRAIPSPYHLVEGQLQIVVVSPDYAALLGVAFDQIRRNAAANVAVILHMVATLDMLGALCVVAGRRADLLAQLDLLDELAARTIAAPHDRTLVFARMGQVRSTLSEPALGLGALTAR